MSSEVLPLRELIKKEYLKCASDPAYFLKKYCLIQHPMQGRIPFILYDFQEVVLKEITHNRYTIILKARQLGLTTLVAGYSLWRMIFLEDQSIFVISKDQNSAKNLVSRVRFMNQNLPSWLKVAEKADNKLSLEFENGSEIKASSSTKYAGRSEALSLLILDEAAFIDKIDDIWASSQQTLATGGDAIILSTPNGIGNFFHKSWVASEAGENGMFPIKLHWSNHPDRDQAWRDEQDGILGHKLAAQECDSDFITSGDTVISGEVIKFYEDTHVKDPIEKTGVDRNYWVWEYPKSGRTYAIVADVARGDGNDFSAFHVIDLDDVRQVAEYRGKLDNNSFGTMLVSEAIKYNHALLVIENSGLGWAAIQKVIDIGYSNLFYMSNDMKYVDVENQITNKIYSEEKKLVAGFNTTSKTRPLILSKLEEYMRDTSVVIQSSRTIAELWTFIWKGSRAEAMHGYNDDLVMSLAITLWVRDTAIRLRQEGINLTKKAIDMIDNSRTKYDPVYNTTPFRENPYEIDVRGQRESITWLLDS